MPRYREKYTLISRETKSGATVFHMRYYPPGSDRRVTVSTGAATIGRAREAADRILEQSAGPTPRLTDYARDFFVWGSCPWIARQHAKGRPFGEYQASIRRAHLDNHILPAFGKKRLEVLTRPMIESWVLTLPLANQSRNHILYTLRIVLREAKSAKLIRDNPLQEMEPLGKNPRKRDVFTMEEFRALFPHGLAELTRIWKTPKYAALFITLATTGIRSGEARALAWRHLLAEGWLHVERAHKVDGSIGTTKTGEERVIALPRRTVEILEWWRGQSPFTAEDHLMFFGMNAVTPLNVETVTHLLPGALGRAGVQIRNRNLVVHSLRHTYNTIMRAVLPAETLRKFTGHRSPEMTELYDHPGLQERILSLKASRTLVEKAWR
jgi:integrase